jgi:hypothetical protein
LTGYLWQFWRVRGYHAEGQRWLEPLLVAAPEPTADRVKALLGAGQFAAWQRQRELGAKRYEQTVILGRALGEERLVGWALREWAFLLLNTDRERACQMLLEGEVLMRRVGDRRGLAANLTMLGRAGLASGDFAGARAHLEESLAVGREVGDRAQLKEALGILSAAAYGQGDFGRARWAWEGGFALAHELGNWPSFVAKQGAAGLVAIAQTDPERAERHLMDVVALGEEQTSAENIAYAKLILSDLARRRGDLVRSRALLSESLATFATPPVGRYGVAMSLARFAATALACRQAMLAARWLGATEAVLQTAEFALQPDDRPVLQAAIDATQAALGDAAFDAAWAAGAVLTLEQAVAEGLDWSGRPEATDSSMGVINQHHPDALRSRDVRNWHRARRRPARRD